MKRFEERKEDLKKATNKLNEALKEEVTDLEIDGILHRFEFTFELAWKTMKDCLEDQGIVGKIGSPREASREIFDDIKEKYILEINKLVKKLDTI